MEEERQGEGGGETGTEPNTTVCATQLGCKVYLTRMASQYLLSKPNTLNQTPKPTLTRPHSGNQMGPSARPAPQCLHHTWEHMNKLNTSTDRAAPQPWSLPEALGTVSGAWTRAGEWDGDTGRWVGRLLSCSIWQQSVLSLETMLSELKTGRLANSVNLLLFLPLEFKNRKQLFHRALVTSVDHNLMFQEVSGQRTDWQVTWQ